MMSPLASRFIEFFAAANAPDSVRPGPKPYPWQIALMEEVARTGRWPDIAAPTGSGKSSIVDIHVFLVAEHARGRIEVRPPRRLVLIAPRRVLVDDQFERAAALRTALADALQTGGDSPLVDTAHALAALCGAQDSPASPIGAWRLRGGIRVDAGWRLEPAACQIICSTPLMWGSRLLFRGYGASARSRNLETGLLAHDAVAVVDEAHLHQRLLDTGRTIAGHQQGRESLQVVSMTATGSPSPHQITLTAADLADEALARRVNASKRLNLVRVDDFEKDAWSDAARAATAVAGGGTVGVFVNDVPTALRVAEALRASGTVELVCGRMRPADLTALRRRRPTLLDSRGDPTVDFLVSTQSLEVGVDLDLPAMVSMLASPTALAQRAGRLNRSGRYDDSVFTVIVPSGEPADVPERSGPYGREDLLAGMDWLASLDGVISPLNVMRTGVPVGARPPLPRIRPIDLETLELTSGPQSADPDPELYLEDPRQRSPEVQIAAREHLDLEAEVVADMLVACPPRAHELVALPLGKNLDRLIEATGDAVWVVRTRAGELSAMPLSDDPLPGDVLVVPDGTPICTAGVVGLFGTGRRTGEPMRSVLAESPEGRPRDTIVAIAADLMSPIVDAEPSLGSRAARERVAGVLEEEGHGDLAAALRTHRYLADIELHWSGGVGAAVGLLLVADMRRRVADSPSVVPSSTVGLGDHQRAVEARLARLIEHLGAGFVERERDALLLSARHHDDGKSHPRFQRRMGADDATGPLAKPAPGHRPDRGDGWRHEQLSAAFAAAASNDDPLVVSLVGAHHGCGRALFDRRAHDLIGPWEGCPTEVASRAQFLFGERGHYEVLRARASNDLGPFRLAWLEALLRCADMQTSREGG